MIPFPLLPPSRHCGQTLLPQRSAKCLSGLGRPGHALGAEQSHSGPDQGRAEAAAASVARLFKVNESLDWRHSLPEKKEESRCASARKGLAGRPAAKQAGAAARRLRSARPAGCGRILFPGPTAVRLFPCTSTGSGCLFPCHLASPGSGGRGLLLASLPSGENRADQSRESKWAGIRLG